ncbi:MAG TPA: NAD-dependent epimerase/dehydratase family protein [candidate division Zixibacteria bacterium]|nr:NAD-dependent epimerase/dehydratase family protein [candidate division Zixibacteria bacterium]
MSRSVSQGAANQPEESTVSQNQKLHVVLGTGQLGRAVIHELVTRGELVRAVSRSKRVPLPKGVEFISANLTDKAAAVRACANASVVYHCASPPYSAWGTLVIPMMETIIEAVAETGGRIVYGDNVYMYGEVEGPITENLPNNATGTKGRIRSKAAFTLMEAHKTGKVKATIGRASDFFGPDVNMSLLGDQVFGRAVKGKVVNLLGDPDTPHSYTYITDFAKALVILGEREEALGHVWHVPNDRAITTFNFVDAIFEAAGKRAKVRVVPKWLYRLMSSFSPVIRELKETDYQRSKPFTVDSSNFTSTFGLTATPLIEAIRKTVAWYQANY